MRTINMVKSLAVLGLALGSVVLALWGTFVSAQTREIAALPTDGPPVTGSEAYRDAGADGSGLTIAVIDNYFCSLFAAQATGDAPPWDQIVDTASFTAHGCTTCTEASLRTHGTRVLEILYDHAPGADYCLYTASSGKNASSLQNAVNAAVAADADIISMSITYFNQGWADGSGGACAAVETATDAGILVFAAAGNFAKQHWRGMFDDPDEDNVHNWLGVVEDLDIRLDSGDAMTVYLQWDLSGGAANYDLYLYDSIYDSTLDSSTNSGNTYEDFHYTFDSDTGTQLVKIQVQKASGNATTIQLFTRDEPLNELIRKGGGSISSPANSDELNVISVGAVHVDSFAYSSGKDSIIESWSSLGPSNSGRIEPDLVSPTKCTTTFSTFSGTSCATPNASGTAAAFWSSVPNYSATGVRHLLLEMAEIFKDWGVPGNDTIYGRGGIRLHTYHANTVWVDRDAGNTAGSDTIPYYYVSDAQDSATAGGRVVFLGDNYPETILLNKELLYESIGGSAVLGE